MQLSLQWEFCWATNSQALSQLQHNCDPRVELGSHSESMHPTSMLGVLACAFPEGQANGIWLWAMGNYSFLSNFPL
jgi:hypothetical protein